jgi:hypothetical protein
MRSSTFAASGESFGGACGSRTVSGRSLVLALDELSTPALSDLLTGQA